MSVYCANDNPLISVTVTHSNLSIRIPEVKFSLMEPICEIKLSLVKRFGTEVDSMKLELRDEEEVKVADMDDELKAFGYYSPQENYYIHVSQEVALSLYFSLDLALNTKFYLFHF